MMSWTQRGALSPNVSIILAFQK
ncbi:UNVERIFIED_CONTAM: hypothetical protein GTU68_054017 [Idotea baltica]|nr:hypothetical protein [Idotea baltica]